MASKDDLLNSIGNIPSDTKQNNVTPFDSEENGQKSDTKRRDRFRKSKGYSSYSPDEWKDLTDYPEAHTKKYRNNPPGPCDVCGTETTNIDVYYDQYFCSNKCYREFEDAVAYASSQLEIEE